MYRPRGNDLDLGFNPRSQGRLTLTREARGKHLYCVGATGTGKSKFLEYLIRQDILAWPTSRCGLIVFDPHGAMFDSLMQWIAASGLRHLPIIPIDLRRRDSIVSYNVLRRRTVGQPSVIVGGLARAIVHAWGQGNMDNTPLLAKWLTVLLGALYEQGHTLLDAMHLLHNPDLRRAMTADLKDPVARTIWGMADHLRPAEFNEQLSSTINRLMRFLSNPTMQAMLCQAGPSLDLGEAIENGSIILVSLATAGGQVDDEDARTFGSMLLSDLWTAAKCRGKKDEGAGGVKPFYGFIDEFQEFLTPTMAATLDQARGFGIHLTMAQQFPSQLIGRGDIGRLVYDSVMANTRSKVCFQLDHPEDLPTLAMWLGRNQINLDEVKHQHYSTKVMDHELRYLPTYGSSTTIGENSSCSQGTGISRSNGGSSGYSHGISHSESETHGTGSNSGESWEEDDGDIFGTDEYPYTASEGRSESDSSSITDTASESWSELASWSESRNRSITHSLGSSSATSQSVSEGPMLMPIMGKEALPPQFRSVEEQIFRFTQLLSGQPDRHGIVRIAGSTVATPIQVPFVGDGKITKRYTETWTARLLGKLPFSLTMANALRQLGERQSTFADRIMATGPITEPAQFKRKINSRSVPPPEEGPDPSPAILPKGPRKPKPLNAAAMTC
jgi:hypothetical protein